MLNATVCSFGVLWVIGENIEHIKHGLADCRERTKASLNYLKQPASSVTRKCQFSFSNK